MLEKDKEGWKRREPKDQGHPQECHMHELGCMIESYHVILEEQLLNGKLATPSVTYVHFSTPARCTRHYIARLGLSLPSLPLLSF